MKRDNYSSKVKSKDGFMKSEIFDSVSKQTKELKRKRDYIQSDEDTSDSEKGYVTIKKERFLPSRATRNNSNKKDTIEAISDIKLNNADRKSVKAGSVTIKADIKSEITDSIPGKVLKSKKKRKTRKKKLKTRIIKSIKPVAIFNESKLKKMLKSIDGKPELNDSQKELKKCVSQMHPTLEPLWTGRPSFILKAINDCLLNRDWDNLTYLVLELVHVNSRYYKPVVKNVCSIMDKLHPVIIENGLQGKFKTIKKYHQLIMDNTTVV